METNTKQNSFILSFIKISRKWFYHIISILIFTNPGLSQYTNLDCKVIEIGPIRQTITNMATFGSGFTFCAYDLPYTRHIDFNAIGEIWQPGWSEFPKGSNCWYLNFAPWIGAKRGNNTLVSTGGPEWLDNEPAYHLTYEFFPTSEPWDTIWVVNRGETVHIPYWPDYTGISDQDFICRYNDYKILNITNHVPLYVDVRQVSYSWISLEFLVHQYWIIPQQENLSDLFFGYYADCSIGCASTISLNQGVADEYGWYDEQKNIGFEKDLVGKGDDDCCIGPIGFTLLTESLSTSINWTWVDGSNEGATVEIIPNNDIDKYNLLKAGIKHDPIQSNKRGSFMYAFGPFQIVVGDTLHITLGQIYGKGLEGVYENLDRFLKLKQQNYLLPAPPPKPPLRVVIANHQIILRWDAHADDINPETYIDHNRGDGITMPFEGYRVYKSTTSEAGPWTLLADFDRIDNDIGNNTGLAYFFTDVGLLNNFEYYYTVTAYARPDSVLGIVQLESSQSANVRLAIPGTAVPKSVGKVAVVPNPYRGDAKYYDYQPPWEKIGVGGTWTEETRRIQFINLPNPCDIKIYTVAGQYVNTLRHHDPTRGYEDWNLTSHVGQAIASGVYLFSVKDLDNGDVQIGKFVIIK